MTHVGSVSMGICYQDKNFINLKSYLIFFIEHWSFQGQVLNCDNIV